MLQPLNLFNTTHPPPQYLQWNITSTWQQWKINRTIHQPNPSSWKSNCCGWLQCSSSMVELQCQNTQTRRSYHQLHWHTQPPTYQWRGHSYIPLPEWNRHLHPWPHFCITLFHRLHNQLGCWSWGNHRIWPRGYPLWIEYITDRRYIYPPCLPTIQL